MLTKFEAFRLVREQGEEKLRVNLIWFDPLEVMYFEQTDPVTSNESALIDCLIALRKDNEAWEVRCLFSQAEIDRLTKMLEARR